MLSAAGVDQGFTIPPFGSPPSVLYPAQAKTFWAIDPVNGSDSNSGLSLGAPLKTAGKLASLMGPIWYLRADTTIKIVNALPASDPLNLVLWNLQGGFLRVLGSPTISYAGVVGAVTAINRAANTPYDYTDATLGVGSVGKRMRPTSGARANYISWLAKDQGAGKYRVTPWTLLNTAAASPGTVPDGQGIVAAADTYVLETLTTVGMMHLRYLATNNAAPPSGNTVPLLVQDITFTQGFNGGPLVSGYPDPTNTPEFYGCDLGSALVYGSILASRQSATTYASASAGPLQYCGALIAGDVSFQTGVMAFLDYDTLVQGGRVRFREGGNGRIGSCGVFDSTSDGVLIEDASLRTLAFLAGVDALYGSGNAGVGVNRAAGGPSYTYVTKPTLTGAGGDSKVGGTVKAWGAIPFIEPANNAAIVAFA